MFNIIILYHYTLNLSDPFFYYFLLDFIFGTKLSYYYKVYYYVSYYTS